MRPGVLTEVVATVMSNLGLERALKRHGIGLVRTPVGDKYVLQEMERRHAPLGGEQSGHIIFRNFATTGDGLLTALRVFEAMRESGQDLDALTQELGDLSAAAGECAREEQAAAGRTGIRRIARSARRKPSSATPGAFWCVSPEPNRWRA